MIDPTVVILANATVEKRMGQLLNKLYEDKGLVGPKGEKGDVGKAGVDGVSIKGDKGDKGDRGDIGPRGFQGPKGDDGSDGISVKGDPGKDGKDGVDGKDGNGILSLAVTEEGSVIAQFTDGVTTNIGKAQINNITNINGGRGGLPTGFFAVNSVSVEGDTLRIRCNNNKVFEVTLPSGGSGGGPADWNTMVNKPATFPPAAHNHIIADTTGLQDALDAKQDELVSGTTIKTVNGQSLLGSGDIPTKQVFVQDTDPGLTEPGLWVQTGLAPGGTGFTFWFEDGL